MTNISNNPISNSLLEDIQSIVEEDSIDTINFDIPSLIRLMEISREDIQTDDELHEFSTALIEKSKENNGRISITDIESIENIFHEKE